MSRNSFVDLKIGNVQLKCKKKPKGNDDCRCRGSANKNVLDLEISCNSIFPRSIIDKKNLAKVQCKM